MILGKAGPRLWRATNPFLLEEERKYWVAKLMDARRAVRSSVSCGEMMARARADVDEAKRALGERGPVWWSDGAPDLNRRLLKNTCYRDWWLLRGM